MDGSLEREIKLRFASAAAARETVIAVGATLVRERRLQSDALVDTTDAQLRGRRCALRVRIESGRAFLTFKGPPQPSVMKLREELETTIGDGVLVLALLERLGYRVWFRYEKYREEFALDDALIAIDETPIGTFVEIEGSDAGIEKTATALGRAAADYVTDSYRGLFVRLCTERGMAPGDMVFSRS